MKKQPVPRLWPPVRDTQLAQCEDDHIPSGSEISDSNVQGLGMSQLPGWIDWAPNAAASAEIPNV